MTRKLQDGTEVKEYKQNIVLQVVTHCPAKWKLQDMETGETYIGQKPIGGEKQVVHWKRIDG
tara:strand:- start:1412 stop:1597 length:186 start_codon:yes stop_codon:yes gene_type:complete